VHWRRCLREFWMLAPLDINNSMRLCPRRQESQSIDPADVPGP
jgi:hypothetical protein